MRLSNCDAAKLGITQRSYGATSFRLGAFGDAWTDWCGGNWKRYYNDQGQCEKGANGRGYEVGFQPPWTLLGVGARGGNWNKKTEEVIKQELEKAAAAAAEEAARRRAVMEAEDAAAKKAAEGGGSGGGANAFFEAPDTAMKVGLAVLALGGAFLLLKKKRGGSLAGYRRRNPNARRSRKKRR